MIAEQQYPSYKGKDGRETMKMLPPTKSANEDCREICVLTNKKALPQVPEYGPSAGIFKQSMGARYRVGIGLSYRPERLHSLAEFVPYGINSLAP